jgi:ubiquinone/menaquinone biosynthesis C-methylase UbiE
MRPEGERYTHGFHDVVVSAHARRTAEDCAAFLLPRLDPDAFVLDVGCGPGTITVGLARYSGQVIGLDAESSVLAVASSHARDEGVENVGFEVGSAYDLRWPDDTFDVVWAHQLLQHLADPRSALREFRRVLKPGGSVAVRDSDFGTMVHAPIEPAIERWLELYHRVTAANGGEADAGRHLLSWVIDAGFMDAETSSATWTYADPDRRTEWGELWAVRITEGSFADHAIANGLADRAEIDEMAAAFRRWATRRAGFWAFIHGEVLALAP